jgi:hypothetical protein
VRGSSDASKRQKKSVKHGGMFSQTRDRRPSLAFGLLAEKGKSKKLTVFLAE